MSRRLLPPYATAVPTRAAALSLMVLLLGAPASLEADSADLPGGHGVRRCDHCGADNLVTGARYMKVERTLDKALDRMARRFNRALGRRVEQVHKVATVGTLLPALLPLVALFALALITVAVVAVTAAWMALSTGGVVSTTVTV